MIFTHDFMIAIAMERYCHRMASVRPSVCLSVCDVDDSWSHTLS